LTGIRAATEKVRARNRYVSVSWAFHQFRQMLAYKAALNGQKVIVVDPRHTSQTCPTCGHTEKENRDKKLHTFQCKKCRYRSNDDRVGAMNLHRKGIDHVGTGATGA
jgi:transposase